MKRILLLSTIFFLTFCVFAEKMAQDPVVKDKPAYVGIDNDLKPLVSEYIGLADKYHIKFTHEVSMGFTELHRGLAVGLCTYQKNFREIDVDRNYWDRISEIQRKMLLFHELTHCLCTRRHDYLNGESYEEDKLEKLLNIFHKYDPKNFFEVQPGYFEDECPLSIMHPVVISDKCAEAHMDEYLEEMFNRCKPY
jgi:hypothetical protein